MMVLACRLAVLLAGVTAISSSGNLHSLAQQANLAVSNSTDTPFVAKKYPMSVNMHSYGSLQFVAKLIILGSCYGFIFGMMGAGGSLILKPILYFGFDIVPFKLAVFNSFFVLMPLAGYGSALGHLKGRVMWRDVAVLSASVSGVGSFIGCALAARVLDRSQLLFFAMLIVCVATYMLIPKGQPSAKETLASFSQTKAMVKPSYSVLVTSALGVVIGMVSGFAGVGGGFVLTPLLLHMGHTMETAVPTSQAVICVSSLAGFCWYAFFNSFALVHMQLVLDVSLMVVAMIGLYFSNIFSAMIAQKTRQHIFATLLIAIGIFTIVTDPGVQNVYWRLPGYATYLDSLNSAGA